MKFFEIVPPDTNFDFIGKWKIAAAFSVAIILLSILAIPLRGIRLGLDFAGGHEIQVKFTEKLPSDEGEIRAIVSSLGVSDPSVVRFGEEGGAEFLIRFRAEAGNVGEPSEVTDKLEDALAQQIGPVTFERVGFVGPKVGADLQSAGLKAIGISCLLILIYIAFRFSPRYAPGAVIAQIHDIIITAGVFVILGYEFDLTVLAALLAILGYSLNDTIIVYDRIRENAALHTKHDLSDVLNKSINQTLSRTLLTSVTTLLAVFALLLLGGPIIRPFALAMIIGILVGTYSSIYVAGPTLLLLEHWFGDSAKSAPTANPKGPRPARA